ncbi:MurR/RpiR family transcriptional regulator [Psychrobacillus sp. NPDC096426]|uniref:MurR/RpiR family transcriptional regulator n=1 Tax=Psychrobacillus sp. NPDC096426 TaxID=3364491 RepID=UPI00380D4C6E
MYQLDWNLEELTPHQKTIADYVQKNIHALLYTTESEIAEQLSLSNATVSRFWKTVGYENFKDFKNHLKEQTEISPANKLENILKQVESNEMQNKLLAQSLQHLQETLLYFSSETFQQAIDLLSNSNNIYIYSPGPSEGLANLIQFRLSRFGLSIHLMPKSGHEIFETLVHMTNNDTILIFGFVQLHPETKVILDHSKTIGCKSIVITDRLISDFNTNADIVLYASRGELWEFHSMVAPTFLIENLIIAVGMQKKEHSIAKLEELNELRRKYKDILPR